MSDTPTKLIVNCETGEQTVVPLTEEEVNALNELAVKAEADRAAAEAKAAEIASAKESANAKLKALGLSDEEIAALSK